MNTRNFARLVLSFFSSFATCLSGSPSPNSQFTVEIVTPSFATKTLIETNASWRYFKGTTEPNAGWDTADAIFLGSAWKTNLAGFGYGDGDDRTLLTDMQNGYSTLYLRTTFSHDQVLDAKRLKFRIDYDDGFIAYLDGKEFARVNAPGERGERQPYDALATAVHEASRTPGGNATETWYFGADFPGLFPHASEGGDLTPHILAIQGMNRTRGDDDFSLVPSLYLEDLFTTVSATSLQLAGRINLVGAAAVVVNGQHALVDFAAQRWSVTYALKPGMNRLIIQALDCEDNLLAFRTKDVLAKSASRLVSGTIAGNTSWNAEGGIIEFTGHVKVSAGSTLTIGAGTTVLFRPGTALSTIGGSINVLGTVSNCVYFLPADGQTPWGGLATSDPGSSLTLRFAEVVAGGIYMTNSATVLLEDTTLRDFSYDQNQLERYLMYAIGYCQFTARGCTFSRYYTAAFGGQTSLQIEDCSFEHAEHDFFKPQDTTPGSVLRRCTFAHSTVIGTDGIDTGANAQIMIDNCLLYDIADKAISVEASTITVRNSLIYGCGTGLAIKDDSRAALNNNSIVDNLTYGVAVYLKNAGAVFAYAAVTNNIIWGNSTNITLRNPDTGSSSPAATVDVCFSDVGGATTYFGTGNIRANPQFIKSSPGDLRLGSASPALSSGAGGADMGGPYLAGASQSVVLLQPPLRQAAPLGSDVSLHTRAMGSPPIFYQWHLNDVAIGGATRPSLVLFNLQAASEGRYRVVVSNRAGASSSAHAMVVRDNPLRIDYSPMAACRNRLQFSGPPGKDFILQASSNLVTWRSIFTNAAPTGIVEFTDSATTNVPRQFYRAAYLP